MGGVHGGRVSQGRPPQHGLPLLGALEVPSQHPPASPPAPGRRGAGASALSPSSPPGLCPRDADLLCPGRPAPAPRAESKVAPCALSVSSLPQAGVRTGQGRDGGGSCHDLVLDKCSRALGAATGQLWPPAHRTPETERASVPGLPLPHTQLLATLPAPPEVPLPPLRQPLLGQCQTAALTASLRDLGCHGTLLSPVEVLASLGFWPWGAGSVLPLLPPRPPAL